MRKRGIVRLPGRHMKSFCSELYAHMEFKEMSPEFAESMKKTLRESFQNEAVYQFAE